MPQLDEGQHELVRVIPRTILPDVLHQLSQAGNGHLVSTDGYKHGGHLFFRQPRLLDKKVMKDVLVAACSCFIESRSLHRVILRLAKAEAMDSMPYVQVFTKLHFEARE